MLRARGRRDEAGCLFFQGALPAGRDKEKKRAWEERDEISRGPGVKKTSHRGSPVLSSPASCPGGAEAHGPSLSVKNKSRGKNLRLPKAKGQSIEMAWKVFSINSSKSNVHLGCNWEETKEKSTCSQRAASFF